MNELRMTVRCCIAFAVIPVARSTGTGTAASAGFGSKREVLGAYADFLSDIGDDTAAIAMYRDAMG